MSMRDYAVNDYGLIITMKLDYDQHDFLEHVKKITNNIFGMED